MARGRGQSQSLITLPSEATRFVFDNNLLSLAPNEFMSLAGAKDADHVE